MKSIRLVTHCYAATLPQYARFLAYQIASIHVYRPQCQVVLDVCYDPTDTATVSVLNYYLGLQCDSFLRLRPMELARLGKRCIGRNESCLESQEDVVFLTDVDHLFYETALDDVVEAMDQAPENAAMIYPTTIEIMRTHFSGDSYASQDYHTRPFLLPGASLFEAKHYNRAIGGVQIVRGSVARNFGYLQGTSWLNPLESKQKPFGTFRDDLAFRRQCEQVGAIVPLSSMPNIKRMRHSSTSYKG